MTEEKEDLKKLETRILKDTAKFDENQRKLDASKLDKNSKLVLELAQRYKSDTTFFLSKGDVFSAFGAIEYAHGLLDALRKQHKPDEE